MERWGKRKDGEDKKWENDGEGEERNGINGYLLHLTRTLSHYYDVM